MTARVLAIAGSDSGGGAGIQADVKTITALGGYAMTAITALTAQDTLGVHGVLPISAEFVEQQISVVLADLGADAIKTGMLGSAEVVRVVARALDRWAPNVPLVVDPVMVAKGGAPLLDDEARVALVEHLLPRAALITPNAPEAELLSGRKIRDADAQVEAAALLVAMGAAAVLVKGGHVPGDTVVDVLLTADGSLHRWEAARIQSTSTHGTGCTLASAIATGIAEGLTLRDAVERAHRYLRRAIETAPKLGGGHGPLNHAHPLQPPPEKAR